MDLEYKDEAIEYKDEDIEDEDEARRWRYK